MCFWFRNSKGAFLSLLGKDVVAAQAGLAL